MFTKKIWLLAVPVAVIAIQGCGGGSGGPTAPTAPTPTLTPAPPVVADNIGRYTNVAPTNGQNNLDSTNFVVGARRSISNNRIELLHQNENEGANGTFVIPIQRAFNISTSALSAGGVSMQPDAPAFVAGRTYSLVDGVAMGDNRAYAVYSETIPSSAATGFRKRLWRAVSGSLVITEAAPDAAGNLDVVGFRLVNAKFEPALSGTPEQAQGSFTFDLNGTTGP